MIRSVRLFVCPQLALWSLTQKSNFASVTASITQYVRPFEFNILSSEIMHEIFFALYHCDPNRPF